MPEHFAEEHKSKLRSPEARKQFFLLGSNCIIVQVYYMLPSVPGAIAVAPARRVIGMAGLTGTMICVPKPVGLAAAGIC